MTGYGWITPSIDGIETCDTVAEYPCFNYPHPKYIIQSITTNGHTEEIPPGILPDFKHFHSSSLKTYKFLFHLNSQTEYVTSYWQQPANEFQRMNEDEFMVLFGGVIL